MAAAAIGAAGGPVPPPGGLVVASVDEVPPPSYTTVSGGTPVVTCRVCQVNYVLKIDQFWQSDILKNFFLNLDSGLYWTAQVIQSSQPRQNYAILLFSDLALVLQKWHFTGIDINSVKTIIPEMTF